MDGSPTGARVLLDGAVSGRAGSAPSSWIVTFQNGFARAGSAVVNESGEILGIVNSPTNLFESLKAQEDLRGRRLIAVSEFKVPLGAAPALLDDMRARGELLGPVIGDMHVLSGGFSAGINRGPTVAPEDQRSEFSTTEKTFTVFVTWSPRERLKGMMSVKLFNADNRQLVQAPPKKADIKKQDLVLTSWRFDMPRTPGVYRADVLMDDKTMWRGWVRLTP
jgi:hypothetical protein